MIDFRNFDARMACALVLFVAAPCPPALACEVIVYWDANFGGQSLRTDADLSYVGDHWNDQISSFRCSR